MPEADIRLPDPEQLIVSSSPHVHSHADVSRIMWWVIAALAPACAVGVWLFGWHALRVLALCSGACVGFEALFCRLAKQPVALCNGSALVTGILLGMNLSAAVPWWGCIIGALLAIGLGKQIYGGLGYNPFNPALVGRVGLLIAFPKIMTTWGPTRFMPAAVTAATPLGGWQTDGAIGTDYLQYALGNMGGCIGETCALALLLGGLLLIALRIIRWQVPVAFVGTVAVITAVVHATAPAGTQPTPLFHVLTGGLFLGAFFMATDMVTSPMNRRGAWVFGIGCGIITSVIRIWGSYPEGVSFSILIMNALVPLIDRATTGKPFGAKRRSTG